ncbi:MAG: hypothetical protein WCQ63_04755 [Methanomethylophilus sp.]
MSANWDALVAYFANGVPGSEYLWAIVIIAVSVAGFIVARKMVSKV